jgi:uncharacterized RDD family membrane protein YckC/cytoskeletal protein CcmA (bactofilin family)
MNTCLVSAGVGRQVLAGLVVWLSITCGEAIERAEPHADRDMDEEIATERAVPAVDDGIRASSRQARSRVGEIVRLGGDVIIGKDEEARDVVIVFGTVRVEGRVHGDMVVVGGRAMVEGVIGGDLVMPFGKLELGPDAEVEGDVVVVLGEMIVAPGAYIGGERYEFTLSAIEAHLPPMTGLRRWVMEGLILARPLPHQPGWWWWYALACALLYVVTALIFHRPIALGVSALESRPVGSFFLGLLAFLLFGPLLLLLVATGVGLLVVPFVLCGGLVALLLGKVAVYQYLGREIGRQTGLAFLRMPMVALIVGIALFYAMYVIPVIGLVVWLLAGLLGSGAAVLAFFDAFRTEGAVVSAGVIAAAPPVTPVYALPAGAISEAVDPPLIPGQPPVPPIVEASSLARVGFWMRFLATLIDLLLVGAVTAMIQQGSWFLPLWVAYHVGLWAWRGTTIGGVTLRLKIVRRDGRDIDFPIALIRSLSSFLSAMALFIGFLRAGWTRERVAWHDQIAGTIVVRMPRGVPLI